MKHFCLWVTPQTMKLSNKCCCSPKVRFIEWPFLDLGFKSWGCIYLELLTILSGQEPLLTVRDGMEQRRHSCYKHCCLTFGGLEQGLCPSRGIHFPLFSHCFISNFFCLILSHSSMEFLSLFSTRSSLWIISLPTCYILCCQKTLSNCRLNKWSRGIIMVPSLWWWLVFLRSHGDWPHSEK